MPTTTRTYHCTEAGSSKFWTIATAADGKSFTVTFGKIGTAGQSKEKSFPSADACAKEAAKLIREKTAKGYIEQGAAPTPSDVAQAAKPAPSASAFSADQKSTAPQKAKSQKPAAKLPPYDEDDPKQQRAFLRAIRSGNLDKIRAYVDSGATLRQYISESRMESTYPFLAALENPQPEIIRYFITLPDYHPTYTGNNQSVLTKIATDTELADADRLAKIELLLECGYDCSGDEFILLQFPAFILPETLARKIHDQASRARDTGEVIHDQLQYGGNIAHDWITTPLKPDPVARLIWMLDRGLNPNFKSCEHTKHARETYGSTLHTVLQLCRADHPLKQALIEKLLEKGADPLAKNKSKLTPWEYAEVADKEIPANIISRLRKAAEAAAKK